MTNEQKLAIAQEVLDNPHLFSARQNRDMETITRELNMTRDADQQLSNDDVLESIKHAATEAAKPKPEAPAE